VDHNGEFGPRFININRRIYKIPLDTSSECPDGVYLDGNVNVTGNFTGKLDTLVYSLSEADEKLGLFRTYELAKDLGDVQATIKQELEQRANEIKNEKLDLENKRIENDRIFQEKQARLDADILKRNEERAANEHLRKQLEDELHLKNLLRKDKFEELSTDRKNSSDILKHIPVIIGSILSLAILLKK
jgi:hypothetical protein